MYIYDMPYLERKELCDIIDKNNKYEELAINYMKFDSSVLHRMRCQILKNQSPTEELLVLWGGIQNRTVAELFILLCKMGQHSALEPIKKFVNPKYHKLINTSNKASSESPEIQAKSSLGGVAGLIQQIPFEELKKSAENWDAKHILGKGGFGIVYKGTWKCTQVAIKKFILQEEGQEQIEQSVRELRYLNSYRHDNVLPIYGYSVDGPETCVVYQFMGGGCLFQRLHRKNAALLSWTTRLNIAVGVARGLQFLHTVGEKPLIHGDIKSANILLDPNDIPRIGDFGLAREGPQYSYIKVDKIHGTRPYLPDEFLRGRKFSTKVDIYSFGVVLFEIGTSLAAYSDKYEQKYLRDFIVQYEGNILDLKDRKVNDGDSHFLNLIGIGKLCVNSKAKDRPEMVSVLLKLEECTSET